MPTRPECDNGDHTFDGQFICIRAGKAAGTKTLRKDHAYPLWLHPKTVRPQKGSRVRQKCTAAHYS